MAHRRGLHRGRGRGLGRGMCGSQRGGVPQACPGPGPGFRGETGAQCLLSLGDAAGKAASVPGKLLPGAPSGSLGGSSPDDQEMDGDLLREVHLETAGHRHTDTGHTRSQVGEGRENQTKITQKCLLSDSSPACHHILHVTH